MKVADLSGGRLDVAVALALGLKVAPSPSEPGWWKVFNSQRGQWDTIMEEAPDEVDPAVWSPSAKWEHGGPIFERENITVIWARENGWLAKDEPSRVRAGARPHPARGSDARFRGKSFRGVLPSNSRRLISSSNRAVSPIN